MRSGQVGDKLETPPDGKLLPIAAVAEIELPDRWSPLAEAADACTRSPVSRRYAERRASPPDG